MMIKNILLITVLVSSVFFVNAQELNKCLSGDCQNGKGKAIYHDPAGFSYTYEGDFVNGRWWGNGVFTVPGKYTYKGDFTQGEPTGKAEITFADGIKYIGEVVKMKKEGQGELIYENGKKLKGMFKADNIWNGEGYVRDENGTIYEGTIVQGKANGKGTFIYAKDGSKYVGSISDSKCNGYGKLYDKTGKLLAEGQWVDDKLQTTKEDEEKQAYRAVLARCFKGEYFVFGNKKVEDAKIELCAQVSNDMVISGTYTATITTKKKDYVFKAEIVGNFGKKDQNIYIKAVKVLRDDELPSKLNWGFSRYDYRVLHIERDGEHPGFYVLTDKSYGNEFRIILRDY